MYTPRTDQIDHLQIIPTVHHPDISRQIYHLVPTLYDLYDPAQVAGWKPHNSHDLQDVSWVGSALRYKANPVQPLTTAGEELYDLSVDR